MKLLKYVLILLLFIGISSTGRSQILISILLGDKLNSGAIEFGLTGGLNWSNIYQMEDAKSLRHFNLGFYFDFRLKKETGWYLYTGCLVKAEAGASNIEVYQIGDEKVDSAFYDGTINRYINYFYVPITVKHRFKNNIFVLGGAALGLRHKARDEFVNSIHDDDDLVYKANTKDYYRRIDAGLTVGAGFKFRYGAMMNMGVRYYYGLTDIYKDDFKNTYGYATNSNLYLFFEIPIGAERKVRPPREPMEKRRKKNDG